MAVALQAYASPVSRGIAGWLAAGLSVLTFHAAAWWVLHKLELMPAPFPLDPTAPFGVPRIVSLTFWGALYGIPFGIASSNLFKPLVFWGFLLGVLACLVGWFIVAPLRGEPVADGSLIIPLVINGTWGIGVALLLPLLLPTRPRRA